MSRPVLRGADHPSSSARARASASAEEGGAPTRSSSPSPSPSSPLPVHSDRRARPRLTEQIQIIRELWLLREQTRVQAAERCFLTELERLLSGGRAYSTQEPPPPTFFQQHTTTTTTATTATTTANHVPLPPPFPPPPVHVGGSVSAVSFLEDGAVFENHPPPRGDHAPARERPGMVSVEMEQARASQRVTNLSAEFRARLEGQHDTTFESMTRSPSFGQLGGQRAVSTVLDSQFRQRLEHMLHRRQSIGAMPPLQQRHLYSRSQATERSNATSTEAMHDAEAVRTTSIRDPLQAVVSALREEVTVLRNAVTASFDLQLDIQRSIRQEVSAAMNAPATLSVYHPSSSSSSTTTSTTPQQQQGTSSSSSSMVEKTRAINAGMCTVCLEGPVDVLLYGCGHMCTCAACGRQLLATGQPCPICRAPVRDVVRAFMVTASS